MNESLTKLLNREDSPEVIRLADILALIHDGMDPNGFDPISQQEYVELMVDVERLKAIIALKKDLELNQLIHDAVTGIIELAKLVKF
jgi:hypothetical protein